uniref:Isopenicillin N synthase-like Fe(2+) 2OG dioxygenase domain-containing protein n=1 Tax=Nothobranchius furzeri TaxID=105023 RepID=A0A1A8B677_NOTFU
MCCVVVLKLASSLLNNHERIVQLCFTFLLQKWPSADFLEIHRSFFQRCKELSLRVLRVMALSLGLDPDVFIRAHALIGTDENKTTLRSLYYPPVKTAKENQLRCGEHSDYGSITLVFQGSDGLQVTPSKSKSEEF